MYSNLSKRLRLAEPEEAVLFRKTNYWCTVFLVESWTYTSFLMNKNPGDYIKRTSNQPGYNKISA